jgi:hypothetical protein
MGRDCRETPWYVRSALGGTGRHPRRTCLRAIAAGLAALALTALFAACGESSSDANEPAGNYTVAVTGASFPTKQFLGQESDLTLGIRNSGKRTVPALVVTMTIAGPAGRNSSLPFGVRDPQPGLAQADRPVWVLEQGYPRLAGSSEPGGAATSNRKTFDFGPLKPGQTTNAVWKLSAVKAGRFTVVYRIGAGLSGNATTQTDSGVAPGGSFVAEVTQETPETEVTDSGEIVEIKPPRAGRSGQGK